MLAIALGLGSSLFWGLADFGGGLQSRRYPVVAVLFVSQAVGLVGIAAGIITFLWPGITALVLLLVIAAWAFLTGVMQLMAAVRLRRVIEGEWLLGLSGALSVLFAILLAIRPGDGALVITWLIGWFAFVFGALLLVLGWRVRKLQARPSMRGARLREATS